MTANIWLTGSNGMVGSSILRKLTEQFGPNGVLATGSQDLDLRNQKTTYDFVNQHRPKIAILCAARVGGVYSNITYPAIFSLENQSMQLNALQALVDHGVQKIIFIGSSCIYPTNAPIPLSPTSLNTGDLEPTNKWYAMAKLSMIYSLDAVATQYGTEVTTLLPTNLYGPNDNFHSLDGHVIPSLLIRAHRAKLNKETELKVWGTGKPLREVLFVDDFADAIFTTLESKNLPRVMNVGSGEEFSIREIAEYVCDVTGFQGKLIFDTNKPDGAFRKLLDSTPIQTFGWNPSTEFKSGLSLTYKWLLLNYSSLREKGVLR